VIVDLAEAQWETVESGQLDAPDGTRFVRRTTRTSRSQADLLVSSGAPLVVYSYGAGQLDWYGGRHVSTMWSQLRTHLTTRPDVSTNRRETVWTAGRWDSKDGQPLLVLTGRC
jgi:hypothetical protein